MTSRRSVSPPVPAGRLALDVVTARDRPGAGWTSSCGYCPDTTCEPAALWASEDCPVVIAHYRCGCGHKWWTSTTCGPDLPVAIATAAREAGNGDGWLPMPVPPSEETAA